MYELFAERDIQLKPELIRQKVFWRCWDDKLTLKNVNELPIVVKQYCGMDVNKRDFHNSMVQIGNGKRNETLEARLL